MASSPEHSAASDEPVLEIVGTVEESIPPERSEAERIGRYDLCFELASGGMATVYLARVAGPVGFEKLVALKRIHPHLAKETRYIEMFLDEARIASRITHPNVCSVFDFGEADGEYYIAMEYLVGEPLSRLCLKLVRNEEERHDPRRPLQTAAIIAHACEGLHAAHEIRDAHGELLHVVHRDVSPRNLFVTYDGSVQVVDFGVASARHRLHQTVSGELKGTFAYMAPEQLTAQPIDRRVDVWALGVTLWETLALKRLFRRETTAKTVHAILYDEIAPPSKYRTNMPQELDEIVLKALQRDPADRWQSARDMGRALRQYLASRPHAIGPAELSEWMARLFPQGEARKSQLMEIARLADEPVPSIRLSDHSMGTITPMNGRLSGVPSVPQNGRRKALLTAGAIGGLVIAAATWFGLQSFRVDSPSIVPMETEAVAAKQRIATSPSKERRVPTEQLDAVKPAGTTTSASAPSGEPEMAKPAETKPKPARRPQRATRQKGTIDLVTRGGWAQVYKGNKLLGATPRRLTLPAGRHKLTFKPFGTGKPKTVFVKVSPNKTKRVSIRLD